MSLRGIFLFLLVNVTLCAAVDITVMKVRQSRFRMRVKCVYNVTEGMDAARFNILLNKPTFSFKSLDLKTIWNVGTSYRVETVKPIQEPTFKVVFVVAYTGMDVPYGICTDLEQVPTELLQNNDMESDFEGNWYCHKNCTLEPSKDSYTGLLSVKVSNRSANQHGLTQYVNITSGARYSLSGFIKLITIVGDAMYHEVELRLSCKNSVTGDKKTVKFGRNIRVQKDIWTEVGAVIPVPEGYDTFRVYVQVSGSTAEYLVDQMSLKKVPDITDWKLKAKERIEILRKANMRIRLRSNSNSALPRGLQIEVNQIKSEFPLGSSVDADLIVNPDYTNYQDFFYDNFEWGQIENGMKWKQMESDQGDIELDGLLNAIYSLKANGIPVRGHNVFWSMKKNTPDWVVALNQTELLQAMEDRVQVQVANMSGLLAHWDVNNANLHGSFYEDRLGDPNITMQMFIDVHKADPYAKLFLSDYAIIETRKSAQIATAIKEQARLFKKADVPIYGIGIQSRIKNATLDITSMKTRLDKVAEAGIALWATKLSVEEEDENKKAQALEDVLYLYFSHPAMDGINLSGFWDGNIYEQSARLVEGADMTPNAAGQVFMTLFNQEWRTFETRNITDESPVSLRGFKGNYIIYVKQNGELLQFENAVLGSSGVELTINLP